MTWRIELHGERPWTTNAERKWHHMQRAAKVKDTREAFGWMAKAHQIPPLGAIAVHATPLARANRWKQDVGACFPAVKAAIDGLVDAGVLPDDDPTFVRSLTFHPTEIGELDGLRLEIEEVEYYGDN